MILFEKIRWKNILSTGNIFTEINLTRSTNTLIVGNNGAGKSTILDTLCFGLFGKPFRKINKPNLLNSINQRDGLVEVEFSVGKKQYKVVRGLKPNIFEIYCDGVMVNQDSSVKDYQEHLEKFILKINFKSFTQVVILGSASFVPFMQLSPADRRSIIEDLLDIQIFSSMNILVKEKMAMIKESISKTKYDIELTNEKIDLQKQNIEEHKNHSVKEIQKKNQEIEISYDQIATLTKDIKGIQKHIDVLQSKIEDKTSVESKSKKLVQLEAKLESNIQKIKKEIEFYENNDQCPTCKQEIEQSFKQKSILEKQEKQETQRTGLTDIGKQIESINSRFAEINKIIKHISEHNSEIIKHNSTISAINKYIGKIQKEVQDLTNRNDNLEEDNIKLKELNEQLVTLNTEHEQILNDRQYYEYASSLLKDTGIKTKIIKQYLPIMNKLINKYLASMDFFVNFNINENFEETIKSRHRDEFTYANFSEGEKQKIDLALLLTWRQIAKLKNSMNTNLLILDEIFDSSLDSVSVDLLMDILKDLTSDTNLFVISHKGDQLFDKFRSVIRFDKKNNFSQVI
jgi:DNA repair exonuclease SbcCD ATPase subunit